MNLGDTNSPTRRTGPRVFISYRRRFDQGSARLVRQELVRAFGEGAVFRDVNNIAPGDIFEQTIADAIKSSDTFLALISPGWLEAAKSLHDPGDFVRMEIAAALQERIRVIPVLVGGAQMPKQEDLPEDIRGLASRHADELSDRRWDDDVQRLIEAIRPKTATTPRPFATRLLAAAHTWPGVVALAVLLLAAGYAVWRSFSTSQASLAQCFRQFLPRSRSTDIEFTDPQWREVARQDQAAGEPVAVVLNDSGRALAAVRLRFVPGGKDEAGNSTGIFRVEGIVDPDCRPVEDYSNLTGGAHKDVLTNYGYLGIRLGERQYVLRLGYKNNSIQAQSHLKAPAN